MRHAVYIIRCADESLYTGYTTDVSRRVAEHNAGDGAKYTRGRTPVTIERVEYWETRSAAQSREYEIKQFPRSRKQALLEQNSPEIPVTFNRD